VGGAADPSRHWSGGGLGLLLVLLLVVTGRIDDQNGMRGQPFMPKSFVACGAGKLRGAAGLSEGTQLGAW
jgi:hypothetical protein